MAAPLRIEFEGDLTQLRAELKKFLGEIEPSSVSKGKGFGKGFSQGFKDAFAGLTAANLTTKGIDIATAKISQAFDNMLNKESSLAEFSAITGVAGGELEKFGEMATELSNKFGGSTIDNIEAFKGVLSRLGPDFASSSKAVGQMGDNINILSKASGLDATQSMDALTTTMLQFGVDLSDPNKAAQEATRIMNELAAGAKYGAAEVPQVAEAMKQVGSTAKSLGVSSVEVGAFIQTLALGGKTGSEAGIALRNVLTGMIRETGPAAEALGNMGLSSQQLGETLSSGPGGANNALKLLRERLELMSSPAERNSALIKIFGVENLAAAQTLISLTGATDDLTNSMSNTNTAVEQANITMNTTQAKWERFQAFVDNQLVATLESGKKAFADLYDSIASIGDAFSGKGGFWQGLSKAGWEATKSIGEAVKYSTLGAIDINKWTGLNKRENEANAKAAAAAKKAEEEKAAAQKKAAEQQEKLFGKAEAREKKASSGRKAAKVKDSPLAGSIGAMQEELRNLENEMTNKLDPSSDAFLSASTKAIALRTQIDLLSESMRSGVTVEAIKMNRAVKDSAASMDEMQARLREQSINTIPLVPTGTLQIDASISALDAMAIAADAAGLSVATLGNIMGTAISGGGDGLKQALKAVGSIAITFAEGMISVSEGVSLAQAIMSGGLTLFKDAPLLALAGIALEGARAYINSLDSGGVLMTDQLIQAHAKETVIPFDKAPAFFAEAVNRGAGGSGSAYPDPYQPPSRHVTSGRVRVDYGDVTSGSRNLRLRQSSRVG